MIEGLPLYDVRESACPLCAAHQPDGQCDQCGQEVGNMAEMKGRGYRSPRPDHAHLISMSGTLTGKEGAFMELCLSCYREAWAVAYPDSPCEV